MENSHLSYTSALGFFEFKPHDPTTLPKERLGESVEGWRNPFEWLKVDSTGKRGEMIESQNNPRIQEKHLREARADPYPVLWGSLASGSWLEIATEYLMAISGFDQKKTAAEKQMHHLAVQ